MGVADQIVGDAHVAEIAAPADYNAVGGRAFDHVAGHHAVGLNGDTYAAGLDILAEEQVADQVALHHGEPASLIEVGDGDANGRPIDQVVGDHRALEGELGIERDLAEPRARIPDHLTIRAGIGADRREGAVGDAVSADQHGTRAKHIDSVAVLAAAAAPGGDPLDTVRRDDGGVLALLRPPHHDAVVAAVPHMVMRDLKTAGVLAKEAPFADVADLAILDPARHLAQHDPILAAA